MKFAGRTNWRKELSTWGRWAARGRWFGYGKSPEEGEQRQRAE